MLCLLKKLTMKYQKYFRALNSASTQLIALLPKLAMALKSTGQAL